MYWATFFFQTFLSGAIAAISLFHFKEREAAIKAIAPIFIISFVCNVAQFLLYISGINVNFVIAFYDFPTIVAFYYFYNIITEGKYRSLLLTITTVVLVWGLYVTFFVQTPGNVTSYMKLGMSFMQTFFAILYFYHLMKELPTIHIHKLPAFWFNAAFLLYASGTIFLYASLKFIVETNATVMGFWIFHNLEFIILQLLVLLGLYFDYQRRAQQPRKTPLH